MTPLGALAVLCFGDFTGGRFSPFFYRDELAKDTLGKGATVT